MKSFSLCPFHQDHLLLPQGVPPLFEGEKQNLCVTLAISRSELYMWRLTESFLCPFILQLPRQFLVVDSLASDGLQQL